MLYIFRIKDQPFFKFGYTASSPWRRAATGFWSNVHPAALCNKLSYADLELVGLYDGGLAEEAAVKASLPPVAGEFWSLELLGLLTTLLDFMQPQAPAARASRDAAARGPARGEAALLLWEVLDALHLRCSLPQVSSPEAAPDHSQWHGQGSLQEVQPRSPEAESQAP